MSLTDLLLGEPLPSSEERAERIGPAAGVPIFGLDALGSAAYGPEAALTMLVPLGAAGIGHIVPISVSIIVLLSIVYFSYRQTIEAYPTGGGSYIVARQNFGPRMGLFAGTALMIDYVLTAAVGISAGVGALVSAAPALQPHTLALCLVILAILTLVNLRGVRDTGLVFMAPTYLFVVCLLAAIAIGVIKTIGSGGHPHPVAPLPRPQTAAAAAGAWLLLRAFANGCTAMTGVEAVSNGVGAFRDPVVKNARATLTIIIATLVILLAGIAILCRAYGIGATEPGQAGYQSVLSQILTAVAGRGWFYYISIASILSVLAMSANTAFADFPRLCRAIARDSYLPRAFASRGRRLVYSHGIHVLTALTGLLLIIFGGVTDRLIPLFAIGAFMAFTLSQTAMVAHWRNKSGHRARTSMIVNGAGAIATAATTLIVLITKFTEGAWIIVVLIPGLLALMISVRRHYDSVGRQIASRAPLDLKTLPRPIAVVPISDWNRISQKALRFALTIAQDVHAVHIDAGEEPDGLRQNWSRYAETPARLAGLDPPRLVVLKSPYRFVLTPILDYIFQLEQDHPDRQIAVVLSELVEGHWYHYFLHNQLGEVLSARLTLGGDRRIIVVNTPWYLRE
jgi:amino acid transporter